VKQNTRLRIGAAAAVATVTVCGGLALAPAAFADPTVASATTQSAVVHPENVTDCTDYLVDHGGLTSKRIAACAVGSLGVPTTEIAIATCTVALIATGIHPVYATAACTMAATPN
jgi:hypothetical protein